MKILLITISISIFTLSCSVEGAWDLLNKQNEILENLSSYDHRIKVTINNSAQDEAFTNFPVLVVLNPGRITYSDISADGSGIKFISSDFSTELSYEVEEWNSGGESYFWVKIPSITALSNSDYFWIYYSSDNNTDTTNSSDVWSNSYLAVWHMNDMSTPIKDSSSYGLDGTEGFFQDPPLHSTVGKISGSQTFDGTSDGLTITPAVVLDNLGPVTFSFWMLDEGYSDHDIILEKGGLLIKLRPSFGMRYSVEYSGGSTVRSRYNNAWAQDIWTSFSITWTGNPDHNDIAVFANSIILTVLDSSSDGTEPRDSDTGFDLTIGSDVAGANSFIGQLDEIRISNVVRSPAWISAQYLSMTDSFLTYGPEENISD